MVIALAAFTAAFCFAAPPAQAQDQESGGLLNRLFGKPAYRVEDPPAAVGRPAAPRDAAAKPAARKKKAVRAPAAEGAEAPQIPVVTKQSDARVVLVIGDFLAGGLAEGLTTAFVQNPNVKILDRTSGSSGFVRKDFLDWAKKADELITAEKPAAIVIMIGANDRQQMQVDGVRETVRSENWNREYAERAAELAKAIAARRVPFIWVGVPPFKPSKMMLDMLAFNEVYRAAASGAGGEFVDIWDGFVDENGAYIASGPDLNGQPARLRANDGINLARPGKRKVAFYAEKPLYKLLGEDPAATAARATAIAARPAYRIYGPFGPSEQQEPADLDVVVDQNEVDRIDPARPIALRTPALDGGTELLGAVAEPRREAQTPAEKLAIEGIAPTPPAGRADQFSSQQVASAAMATRQVDVDSTRNKKLVPAGPLLTAVDRAALRTVRANVLSEPQPPMPARMPPEVRPDRAEEISPLRPAPDIAAPEPPVITPATAGKAATPDFAKGDPLDLSPARGAPRESYKRPKSIGPEPNRAPTAVPQPAEEIFKPAEAESEIPSASAGEPEPAADAKPALPDSAPARALVPNIPAEIADDPAPARGAPRRAVPVPVAALPTAKDAPTEIGPAPAAPLAVVPNAPVEPVDGLAAAKAVSALAPGDVTGGAPARTAPAAEATAPASAPVRTAPSAAVETMIDSTQEALAPTASAPAAEGSSAVGSAIQAAPGQPGAEAVEVVPAEPSTPVAPAPPTLLSNEVDETGAGEAAGIGVQPATPPTPVSPAPPTVLPERAVTPQPPMPGERASLPAEPEKVVRRREISFVRPAPTAGQPAIALP